MGRIIVLKIDDDECVRNFRNNLPQGVEVIGSYMIPTKFCTCNNLISRDGFLKPGQFVRGSKFGLYVHTVCKLPYEGHRHYPKNLELPPLAPRQGPGMHISTAFPYTQTVQYGQ